MSKSLRLPKQRSLRVLHSASFAPALAPSVDPNGCGNCSGYQPHVKIRVDGELHEVTCPVCHGTGR